MHLADRGFSDAFRVVAQWFLGSDPSTWWFTIIGMARGMSYPPLVCIYIDCVFCWLGWGDLHWAWSSSKNNQYIYIYAYVSYLRNFYQNLQRRILSIICVPDVRPLQVAFVHQTFMVSSSYNMCFLYILYISKISPHLREDMLKKHSHNIPANIFWGISTWKKNFV